MGYAQYQHRRIFGKYNPWKLLLLFVLLAIFLFSVVNVVIYIFDFFHNQNMQTAMVTQHQISTGTKQTELSPKLNAESAEQTKMLPATQNPVSTAMVASSYAAAKKNFFQVIGVTQDSLKPFVKQNNDTIGWIRIDPIVDLPIVYRDNSYYLNHDYYGNKSIYGTIFLDVNHPVRSDSQNLLLHGHNMKDGSMFGRLTKYLEYKFTRNHYAIQLETRLERFTYFVFAVAVVSTDNKKADFLYYWGHSSFANESAFIAYIDEIYDRSIYTRYLDVEYTDTLLTLSTCYDKERLVVFARRQRENETQSDVQRALLGMVEK
ncbi:MAG TPA: class B sortase [Candidatus Limiplasma sp.]|nr:class B sortase [Candidatus Limiplasma sp.]